MLSDFEIRYGAPTKEELACSLNDDTSGEEETNYFRDGAPKKQRKKQTKKTNPNTDN